MFCRCRGLRLWYSYVKVSWVDSNRSCSSCFSIFLTRTRSRLVLRLSLSCHIFFSTSDSKAIEISSLFEFSVSLIHLSGLPLSIDLFSSDEEVFSALSVVKSLWSRSFEAWLKWSLLAARFIRLFCRTFSKLRRRFSKSFLRGSLISVEAGWRYWSSSIGV